MLLFRQPETFVEFMLMFFATMKHVFLQETMPKLCQVNPRQCLKYRQNVFV